MPSHLKSKWRRLFLDAPQAKLQRLNEIVWPEIWRLAEEKIHQAHAEGYRVCSIDAAVLLKAGWDRHVHEVWVAIAPEKEVRDATCGCSLCTEYHMCCIYPKAGLCTCTGKGDIPPLPHIKTKYYNNYMHVHALKINTSTLKPFHFAGGLGGGG